MRTIKFRAWDKLNQKMWDVLQYLPYAWENWTVKITNMSSTWYMSDDFELMQFTWLLDKNGKEIYEWDILKFRTKENNFVKVYFDDGGFKMKVWNTISSLSYFLGKYQCEVIWNIYESPELLTK